MSRRSRSLLVAGLVTALAAGLSTAPATARLSSPSGEASINAVFDPESPVTHNWTREHALGIEPAPRTTMPTIPEDFPLMTEEVWVWDTWPLTDLQGRPVAFDGWNVIFSLTAPRDVGFNDRHSIAKIGYFYSRNARDWIYGGDLFPAGTGLGQRQWAGSAVYTGENRVHSFYTASGDEEATENSPDDVLQKLAVSTGRIHADDDGVFFRGFTDHDIIAEADGELYQTFEQSEGGSTGYEEGPIIYGFRDPWVFRDPVDGNIYALFEGNNAGDAGTHTCDAHEIGDVPVGHEVPDESVYYTGNVGLLELEDDNLLMEEQEWELLPPILSAECVNQQTERPHLTWQNGQYYLWFISHTFTFAPGLTGPDGVYGFVGDGLRSDYQPLNQSGLVLGNPEGANDQTYSHYVMPNLLVESFIGTVPTADGPVDAGTLAPTVELEIFGPQGRSTRVADVLPYGYIPALRAVGPDTPV